MLEKDLCPSNQCTGCGVCASVCPCKCIAMLEDSEGFLIPNIDSAKCANCGLCHKTCPSMNKLKGHENPIAYAAQIKNRLALSKSASGGVAYLIAKKFIEDDGVVIGCAFDASLTARHIVVKSLDDLQRLHGSKYVQSNTINVYENIKSLINAGKKILFIGTPCQVASVNKFVKHTDRLLTIDLICHGVSSPLLFQKYIDWREKTAPLNERSYQFRDKSLKGWGTTCSYVVKKKGKTCITYCRSDRDPYYSDFLSGMNYRECCYNCIYANCNRVGDFTVGDYWGIRREHPEFSNVKEGVSVFLINSPKGEEFFQEIKDDLILTPSSVKKISNNNKNLIHPAQRPESRSRYYEMLDFPYENYAKKFYFSSRYLAATLKEFVHLILDATSKKRITLNKNNQT